MKDKSNYREWHNRRVRQIFGLSPRQAEAAYCLQCGMRNDRVAETMGIEISKAKRHVHEAFAKVGVKSRLELVAAIENTLAELEDEEGEDGEGGEENETDVS